MGSDQREGGHTTAWDKVVDREIASYPGATATSAELVKALAEVGQQARNVFLVYVSVCAYAILTLFSVKDADFFGAAAGIKLPLIDVQARPKLFFVAMPLLLLLVCTYLHIYLGQIHRIRRRLVWHERHGNTRTDPDALYPWIAVLATQGGVYGAMVRLVYGALVWWAAPAILIASWFRLLPLRSSFAQVFRSNSPPSAPAAGVIALIAVVAASVWSAARRSLDARFKLGTPVSGAQWVRRGLLAFGVLAALVWQDGWYRKVCQGQALRGACRLKMYQATLSTPASGGLPRALGIKMMGLRLDNADLHAAYLENANLSNSRLANADLDEVFAKNLTAREADFAHASFVRAHLEGAKFGGAILDDVDLSDAHLEGALFNSARLDRVVMVDSRAEGTDFFKASLEEARLWRTHFEGARFRLARLAGARLTDAHLEGASLSQAHLEGAHLAGAYLEVANLSEAHLEGADLSAAHLEGADLSGSHLHGANLSGAFLDGADLTGAHLDGSALPIPGESLPKNTAQTLARLSGVPASFDGAVATTVCGLAVKGTDWDFIVGQAECRKMQRAAMSRRLDNSPALRAILQKTPTWANWAAAE